MEARATRARPRAEWPGRRGEGGEDVGGGEFEVGGQAGRGNAGGRAGDARLHIDGAEGAGEAAGEALGGLPLV